MCLPNDLYVAGSENLGNPNCRRYVLPQVSAVTQVLDTGMVDVHADALAYESVERSTGLIFILDPGETDA